MTTSKQILGAAVELLQADLVWSSDFEAIRVSLLEWLNVEYRLALAGFDVSMEAVALGEALLGGQDDA